MNERRLNVVAELLDLVDPLALSVIRERLRSGKALDEGIARRISRFDDMSALASTKVVNLANIGAANYEFLSKLVVVERLILSGSRITDISPIANLARLKHIDLSNTMITDIEGLNKCTGLETINLSYTPVEDVKELVALPNVRMLAIMGTDVDELPKTLLSKLQKVYTNSNELRRSLPKEKLMEPAQALRVFG